MTITNITPEQLGLIFNALEARADFYGSFEMSAAEAGLTEWQEHWRDKVEDCYELISLIATNTK